MMNEYIPLLTVSSPTLLYVDAVASFVENVNLVAHAIGAHLTVTILPEREYVKFALAVSAAPKIASGLAP